MKKQSLGGGGGTLLPELASGALPLSSQTLIPRHEITKVCASLCWTRKLEYLLARWQIHLASCDSDSVERDGTYSSTLTGMPGE